MIKRFSIIALILLANLIGDRVTKHWAGQHLDRSKITPVIGNLFILTYSENDGAFLSLGSGFSARVKPLLFTFLPLLIMLGLLIGVVYNYAWKGLMDRVSMTAFCCIIGGGAGNLYDRLLNNGWVVDFMNFGLGPVRTGILNFADLSITFGIIALLVRELASRKSIK